MRRFAHADISPAPWLQALLNGERFSDPSELLPVRYGILAAIHDKHPGRRETVTPPVWPEYLLLNVWRLLDPLHGLPAETIKDAVAAVEQDLTATIEAQPKKTHTEGDLPTDLMTLGAVVKSYQVSRATCTRAIAAGELKSYRRKREACHKVSEEAVRRLYLPRP